MEIGVLGATGPAGAGLAARLASVGHEVIAGSRDPDRAAALVAKVADRWGDRVGGLRGAANADAARAADVVVIATNWDAAIATAREHAAVLEDKVVISMANGLEKVGGEFHVVLPEGRPISETIQEAVPMARVVAAFQHVPAAAFAEIDAAMESDVIVVGNDDGARGVVLDLVVGIPNLRAFDGGSLVNALGVEAFAAVLLSANVRHKGKGTLRLLGLDGHHPEGRSPEVPAAQRS
jgi:8-hydroxy-5-deazaflavin:NADPH oxidoreductase